MDMAPCPEDKKSAGGPGSIAEQSVDHGVDVLLGGGDGLHDATEGFGIVGPMSGEPDRPSWRFLGLLGLVGGGTTFLGMVVGQAWVSEAVSVAFFAVAARSILFVVQERFSVSSFGYPVLVAWMVLTGLFLGHATRLRRRGPRG